jgi:hypothetical protein
MKFEELTLSQQINMVEDLLGIEYNKQLDNLLTYLYDKVGEEE